MEENTKEKSKERLKIIEKIENLEREGKFDVDPEEDPPTIPLMPDKVDYLDKKLSSKFKTKIANFVGERFLNSIIKDKKLIIKEIKGLEYIKELKSGAIITCNHFNPFDSFAVEYAFKEAGLLKSKKLYKIIREGNYTNFPGLYGFFFRNCDTLPLSSNMDTMAKFLEAVKVILKRGDNILIYPEQSMWWNYKKPKPLKDGAFKLASKNNVPIVPIFITMKESDIIGEDGFNIMQYYINIKKPIYSEEKLSPKKNAKIMKEKNFDIWKNVYENFYNMPLEYNFVKEELK